jgi:PAS domain S-box-containing protein
MGTVTRRPHWPLLAQLLGDGPGSRLARRRLPWAVVAALGVGWLLRHAFRTGRLDVVHVVAALTAALLIALVGLIVWSAGSLNRYDEERRQFFELSQDLLAVADFEGHFVELNPQWERQLGWTREELLRRPFIELVHPDDVAGTLHEYARANEGQAVLRFTNRYRTRGGDYRWLEWCATTVPRLRRGFAVARDVSELRRLERDLAQRVEDLRNVNQELEAFSYSVSHDLRAPLRHIAGFANLLSAQAAQGLTPEARRWLAIIESSTRRMGALIDDLLAFSRIARASLASQPVDLTALVGQVWEEVRQSRNGRPVRWSVGPLPTVLGDAALLRVAFANLLDNALKYSGTQPLPEIRVEAAVEGGQAVVAVRDNGVGFDMRYADKLFGVFQRLDSREEFEGTGIGLATVQRVVARHGGRVWAESEPGRGATFKVALPAVPAERAA